MALSRTDPRTVQDFVTAAHRSIQAEILNRQGGAIAVTERARRNIYARTKAGIDRHDNRFHPYAERTKRYKRRMRQRIRPPSLTDSEQMLDDMTVKDVGRSTISTAGGTATTQFVIGQLGFATRRSEEIATFHIEGTVYMPQRDFFGLTPNDEAELSDLYGVHLARAVPRDRRRKVRVTVFSA